MNLYEYLKDVETSIDVISEDTTSVNITDTFVNKSTNKTDAEYFDTFNPETGLRYDIPMLGVTDPAYYFKYVDYMKMREQNEDTFEKMIGWE